MSVVPFRIPYYVRVHHERVHRERDKPDTESLQILLDSSWSLSRIPFRARDRR